MKTHELERMTSMVREMSVKAVIQQSLTNCMKCDSTIQSSDRCGSMK